MILKLINHDETNNSIYLFLRPQKRMKYYYLGKLRYKSHDQTKEKPCHIQWEILDWDIPKKLFQEIQQYQLKTSLQTDALKPKILFISSSEDQTLKYSISKYLESIGLELIDPKTGINIQESIYTTIKSVDMIIVNISDYNTTIAYTLGLA